MFVSDYLRVSEGHYGIMSVSNMSSEGNKYKVIVIGDPGVGKTALTFRFCEGQYRDNLKVTVGVDIRVKKVQVDGETITVSCLGCTFVSSRVLSIL